MVRRVAVTPEAAAAFRNARQWLMQPGSGRAGALRWQKLRGIRKILQRSPYIGPAFAGQPGVRVVVVSDYRVLYQVVPDTGDTQSAGDILIVALFGPGQEFIN